MHLSQSARVIAIGSLLVCAYSSAEDRSASSSQRYTIHVAKEVRFGPAQPSAVSEPEDAESLVFLAETTSGLTIQFDTEAESARKLPLKLTLGGSQRGHWWANEAENANESTHESVAEATRVQASTLGAGWTTLRIDVSSPPTASDETLTTIVVTIVAH